VYHFTAPADGSATVSLTDLPVGVDLDVFVLNGATGTCDPGTCLTFGNTTATFDIVEGQTYYLAVDGYLGAEGTYTVTLNCELEDRCSPAGALTCGETLFGNNDWAGSTNSVFAYSCTTWNESGPEYAYSFVAPVDGTYTVGIDGMIYDLDVFVMDGSASTCDPDQCIAYDSDTATWTGVAGTTYYIAVDGFGGVADNYEITMACPPLDVCVPEREVECGAHVEASTLDAAATDNVDLYSCAPFNENGPEMAYAFVPRTTADTTVALASLTAGQDLDLFVVQATDGVCDPDACIASDTSAGSTGEVTFHAEVGQTYYLVVDGWNGAAGDFTLDVSCAVGCAPRLTLDCGSVELGNNGGEGSTDRVDGYSCAGWNESGPEYAYSFTATEDGQITTTISDMVADLDIFVLTDLGGSCLPEACVAFGDSSATFDAVTGQTYYVVVDGYSGAADDYIVEVVCAGPVCDVDRDGFDSEDAGCGGDDCDDTNSNVNPGAEEVCGDEVDQDCDGADELCPDCTDADGDGWGVGATCPAEQDCDDTSPDIYPTAEERCGDGIDQDCDGEDLACACGDRDGDGYDSGDGCTPPVDCNDGDNTIYPDAEEACGDGIDQDCDGADESCPFCEDADGDGFGEGAGCVGPDCDDADAAINPNAEEVCGDGDDNDCEGGDETCPENCTDGDGDGYGVGADCLGPDCNDGSAQINPEAREICDDGIDQDCDDEDEACTCDDDDGDGATDEDCGGDDCDDADDTIYPGAEEVCGDGYDQDCDGEDLDCPCEDADDDGFESRDCGGDDCDDADSAINPDADDPCEGGPDGIDQDCDGADDCPCTDADNDGFFAEDGCGGEIDCGPNDNSVYPGAPEECGDDIDQDCDDEDSCCTCDTDGDEDGHVSVDCCGGDDCADSDDAVYGGADEVCGNGNDDDCDREIDEDDCVGSTETSSGCDCAVSGARGPGAAAGQLALMLGLVGVLRLLRRP
jgi:hypothetical protein